MKLAVVTPQPTPYRDPFWNHLAQRPEVDLHVFYCDGVGADRPWEVSWEMRYRAEIMKGFPVLPYGNSRFNPSIWRRLEEGSYDALLVGGYNHLTMQVAVLFARRRGIPYFVMNEVYLAQPRAAWRKIVKHPLVRSIVRNAAGGFPTGTLASEYLVHYGMDPARMSKVPNVPDVDDMRRVGGLPSLEEKVRLKKEKHLGSDPVILFVGRLIPLKQVDTLLEACARVFPERPGRLVVIGDGPERPRLEEMSRKLGLGDRVHFPGFLQPESLPSWYRAADLFVLPSSDETWGAVVIEALAAGVPVIVSDLVGAHADVINEPRIGSVVKAKSVDELADALIKHNDDPVAPEEVASLWEPVRGDMRYATVADNMIRLLREVVGQTPSLSMASGA